MELIGLFLILISLGLLFGPTIAAFVVARRSRANRKRIEALEEDMTTLRNVLERRAKELRDRLLELERRPVDPTLIPPPAVPAPLTAVEVEPPPEPHVPPERTLEPTFEEGTAPSVAPEALLSPPVTEAPKTEPQRPSPMPPEHRRPRIDWEQWVGVRGAAVLGGIVLSLAALLFLKYSIEQGLIPPLVRVGIGFFVGIGAIAAAERLRPRGYDAAGNALAGAGAVILYGSTWASHVLYGLVPDVVAWGLMILVTATCGMLSWRHRSLVIASLGLAGGFVTPLLLQSGLDQPMSLFGYLLVLNAGVMTLALRRRWPALAAIALGLTALYQALWILDRMHSEEALLGILILGVFAALFVFVRRRHEEEPEGLTWRLTRGAALLIPFAFGLYFAGSAEIGPSLKPLAALLALLSATAVWLAPRLGLRWLGLAAAAGDLAVVLVWITSQWFETNLAWEAAAVFIGLALAFHVPLELRHGRGEKLDGTSTAAFVAAAGLGAVALIGPFRSGPFLWPWLLTWLGLAGLLWRQSVLTRGGAMLLTAAAETAMGLGFFFVYHGHNGAVSPSTNPLFGIVVALAVLWHLVAIASERWSLGRPGALAAGLYPTVGLVFLLGKAAIGGLQAELFFGATILLAFLGALGFTRMRAGLGYAIVTALLAMAHWTWTVETPMLSHRPETALLGLLAQFGAALLFTAWPFLAKGAFVHSRLAWYAAALAGPAWFFSMLPLWRISLGEAAIGVLPVALGAVSLVAALKGREIGEAGDPQQRRNLVWFSAIALVFVSVAIPLQLDKEWITIGWALAGIAVLALWSRLDHPGLKYFGLALLAATSVRLLANPGILDYHPAGGTPVFNWLLYTYLVPAAALLGAAWLLAQLEVSRARRFETALYAKGKPVAAVVCSLTAILVVFAWINLTIVDAFSTGSQLSLTLERLPARDLTLSLAWALYALILLGVGMRRRSSGLRWISLAFLVVTIGKVFLYDLGELEDLYRVASLVGLAISLLAVSLAYQRFVFGSSEDS